VRGISPSHGTQLKPCAEAGLGNLTNISCRLFPASGYPEAGGRLRWTGLDRKTGLTPTPSPCGNHLSGPFTAYNLLDINRLQFPPIN